MVQKLTNKQRRFVDEYLIDLNATQAAIRAGYSEKTAVEIGYENLRKPRLAEAIQLAMEKRQERTEITQDRVLREYARLAFNDPRQFFDQEGRLISIHELTRAAAAAVAGFDAKRIISKDGEQTEILKIKLSDKRASLADLSKHLGMFEKDNDQRREHVTVNLNLAGKQKE